MKQSGFPWRSSGAFGAALKLALLSAPWATLAALRDIALGKRVRGWNALCRLACGHADFYRLWSQHFAPLHEAAWIGKAAPLEDLAIAHLPGGSSRLAERFIAAEQKGLRWFVPLLSDDSVSDSLARVLGAALSRWSDADIIYWDEDERTLEGPARPWIKPQWDPLLHKARDCLGGASAVRIEAAMAVLAQHPQLPATAEGLARLQQGMLDAGARPHHVPLVLTHRTAPTDRVEHWASFVRAHWPDWQVGTKSQAPGFAQVLPPEPDTWPSVSIIIPARDRPDLMQSCLSGLARLRYPGPVEIIVVDNGSSDAAMLALLAAAQENRTIRVLRDDGPFNFSRLNNIAAASSSHEYLCLLNNDVEPCDGDWLNAMMRHCIQPAVGAVGARLLYPNGRIQHAGVALGVGNAAGHVQRGVEPASRDHCSWHSVSRQVSAVTAACLLVARHHYEAVGGLDADGFAVAFNDVDFCLKLQARGLANIWCAEATLFHAESCSRPHDMRRDQRERFERELRLLQARWHTAVCNDPHHSPLFSRSFEQCTLALI